MSGGRLGGWLGSRAGLKKLQQPLVLCRHPPNAVLVALAALQPTSLWVVSAAVAVGYVNLFAWVCVATLPSVLAAALMRVVPGFGREG